MDIDPQWIINSLFGLLGICLGYILNNVRAAVERLQNQDAALADKVQHIEVLVAGQYVRREEFSRICDKLFLKLDQIDGKLDGKQDK